MVNERQGAALGVAPLPDVALPMEMEPNNSQATANIASYNFAPQGGNLYHLGITGVVTAGADWFNIGTLQPNDVLTLGMSGVDSARGTVTDPLLLLYRAGSASPVVFDDDSGPGRDALINRLTITTADVYYVEAVSFSGTPGTFQLGADLQAAAPPATGGVKTAETLFANKESTADDFSNCWRAAPYRSDTAATMTAGDSDFYAYQFNAGDLISLNVHSSGSNLFHPARDAAQFGWNDRRPGRWHQHGIDR